MAEAKQLPAQTQSAPARPQLPATMQNKVQLPFMTDEVKQFCKFAVESGFFRESGITNEAQAVMKIAYGHQLGLDPMTSINWLYIIKGKVALESNAIADAISNHPRYNFEITEHTDQICTVQITYDGKPKGDPTSFTWDQACAMGLGGKAAWKNDRRLMLFYKAINRAYKLYARDVFKMTVQSVEDMEDVKYVEARALVEEAQAKEAKRLEKFAQKNKDVVPAGGGNTSPSSNAQQVQQVEDAVIVSEQGQDTAAGLAPVGELQGQETPDRQPSTSSPDSVVTDGDLAEAVEFAKKHGWTASQLVVRVKKPLKKLTVGELDDLMNFVGANPKQ